jgi:hypothetical protein
MGEVQLLAKFCTVEGLIVDRLEIGVNFIDRWGRVFTFAKDAPVVDVMKDGVKFMRLFGEPRSSWKTFLARLLPMGLDLWVTQIGDVVFGIPVGAVIRAALGFTAKVRMISLVEAATDAGVLVLIATW